MANYDCEHFQTLISAQLDGELDQAEWSELQAHVQSCPGCLDFRRGCVQVAFAYAALSAEDGRSEEEGFAAVVNPAPLSRANGHDALSVNALPVKALPAPGLPVTALPGDTKRIAPKTLPAKLHPPSARRMPGPWFWAAVAAGLMVAVVSSAWWQLRAPPQPQISLNPLLVRYANNVEAEQDQQSTLRIVQMDLRTMRLELEQLQLDPETRAQLSKRIETLLAKTNQLSQSPVTYRGEVR